ncbi:MAG: glycosyltransferase family 2 protein [Gammaproteobacteria bacterium]
MSAQSSPHLSASIVSYNTPDADLRALLTSLAANLQQLKDNDPNFSATIWLVDNSDQHPVTREEFALYQETLAGCAARLELLQGHGNVGYGAAHNLAINCAEAEFHLILNPDVVLAENCLLNGMAFLKNNADVAMVGPAAQDNAGEKQYLCKRYPSVGLFLARGFFPAWLQRPFKKALDNYEMRDLSEDKPDMNIPILSGCFMLCRRDALRQVAGFDERYFLYFEDFDLSIRMGHVGELAYLPTMGIQHGGGNSAGKGLAHLRMFARSGIRFFATHGWRLF